MILPPGRNGEVLFSHGFANAPACTKLRNRPHRQAWMHEKKFGLRDLSPWWETQTIFLASAANATPDQGSAIWFANSSLTC